MQQTSIKNEQRGAVQRRGVLFMESAQESADVVISSPYQSAHVNGFDQDLIDTRRFRFISYSSAAGEHHYGGCHPKSERPDEPTKRRSSRTAPPPLPGSLTGRSKLSTLAQFTSWRSGTATGRWSAPPATRSTTRREKKSQEEMTLKSFEGGTDASHGAAVTCKDLGPSL
jgi:hypothetical protein